MRVLRFFFGVLATGMVVAWAIEPRPVDTYGPVFPITEPDLLDTITHAVATTDLDAVVAQAQQRAKAYVDAPPPVAGLVAATQTKTRLFDPSITVDRAVVDATGTVIYPVGSTVNPLAKVTLTGPLIIIDERSKPQAEFAAAQSKEQKHSRVILVGGSPTRYAQNYGGRVYFDQYGIISQRLQLTELPAVVTQAGLALRIDTLALGGTD